MIVRVCSCTLVLPSSSPNAPNSARSAGAITSPARMPRIDAPRPITSDSTITERITCRREAPSVRNSANSRVRCATVTVNVLKIRKLPTSRATPANTSSAVRMKPSASDRSCACFSACSLPVRTAKSRPPSSRLIAALSCSGDVPLSAATEMSSNPSWPVTRCASASVNSTRREPARFSESPTVATPATLYCLAGCWPCTVTVSPSWKSYLSAVALSMTTSSSLDGGPPSL